MGLAALCLGWAICEECPATLHEELSQSSRIFLLCVLTVSPVAIEFREQLLSAVRDATRREELCCPKKKEVILPTVLVLLTAQTPTDSTTQTA